MLSGQMRAAVRYLVIAIAIVQAFLAAAFFLQWQPVVSLWPFPESTPLTFIFIASIFAAAAASQVWAAATKNYGAMAGIGLDYLATFAGIALVTLTFEPFNPMARTVLFVVSVATALFGLGLALWASRIPIPAQPAQPNSVRWSFVVFIVGLLGVGGLAALGNPGVIPWSMSVDLGRLAGVMFVGSAAYFVSAFLRPSWLNSAGQLLGFLLYDLVLIGPFLLRLPTTPPEFFMGLAIYTLVVVYSGALTIYYVFVNAATRRSTWIIQRR